MTSLFLFNQAFAYPQWHEAEVTITDSKPWYGMFLENERVNMNLSIKNNMNETHTFYLLERTDSFTNPELTRHINNTIYDPVTIKANSTQIIPYSQQLPVGSWYLFVMVMSDNYQSNQVDDEVQYFVVQPVQDLYIFITALAGFGAAIAAFLGLFINSISYGKRSKSNDTQTLLMLENEFKSIENKLVEIHKMDDLKQIKQKKLAGWEYYWAFLYFFNKLAHMYREHMIPKKTIEFFIDGFPLALTLRNLDWINRVQIDASTKNLKEWCDKKNIQPQDLSDKMRLELPDGVLRTPLIKKSDFDLSKGVKLDHD